MPGSRYYAVCSPGRLFSFRVVYSCVGIVVGLTVAAIFPVRFDNLHAGGWGLGSALFAFLTLLQFIYLYVVKEKKRSAPNPWILFVFGLAGCVGIGAGVGGFAAYLGLGILDTINHREPSLPASHYVVCVWCFMNFKWGLTAFLYALRSFKYLDKVVKFRSMKNDDYADDDEIDRDIQTHVEEGQEESGSLDEKDLIPSLSNEVRT